MRSGLGLLSAQAGLLKPRPILRIHAVTFPILFVAGLLAEASRGILSAPLAWTALMYGPILLVTVLIHELGHSLAARRLNGHAEGILLWPLGGLAYIAHSSGPKADLAIALAGPLTHIPQLLFWLGCLLPAYHAAYGSWHASLAIPPPSQHFVLALIAGACQVLGWAVWEVMQVACGFHMPLHTEKLDQNSSPRFVSPLWLQINIALAAFNLLLPAYPLDGGRIFADTLLLAGVHPEPAAKATVGVACVLGGGVVGYGIWHVQYMTIAVGAWMLHATYQLWKSIQAGTIEQHPMFSFTAAGTEASGATALLGNAAGYSRFASDV
jgi:Zn-dependent protease